MLVELIALGGIACSDGNGQFQRALESIEAPETVQIELSRRRGGMVARSNVRFRDVHLQRSFETEDMRCAALAEAVAFWIRMALDDNETIKGYRAERTKGGGQDASAVSRTTNQQPLRRVDGERGSGRGRSEIVLSDANGQSDEENSNDRSAESPRRNAVRNFDVGGFVLAGVGKQTILGAAISPTFTLFDALLRTSVLLGQDLSPEQAPLFGTAIAICKRFPGDYARAQGISFDVCGEATGTFYRQGDLQVAIGPSAALRGEVSEHFAMELRISAGANITKSVATVDPPSRFASRGELNLSWKP